MKFEVILTTKSLDLLARFDVVSCFAKEFHAKSLTIVWKLLSDDNFPQIFRDLTKTGLAQFCGTLESACTPILTQFGETLEA